MKRGRISEIELVGEVYLRARFGPFDGCDGDVGDVVLMGYLCVVPLIHSQFWGYGYEFLIIIIYPSMVAPGLRFSCGVMTWRGEMRWVGWQVGIPRPQLAS